MNEGVVSWTSKMEFPSDRYAIRCIEEEVGSSKKDNPMITRTWEIVHDKPVQVGEKQVSINGLKITQYVTFKVKSEDGDGWDMEKSDKAFGRAKEELLAMGFDADGEIDDENPPAFAKGKTFDAIINSFKDVARKMPTPEQRKKGQAGDAIKDGDGNDVVNYKLNLSQVLGPASVAAAGVY